MNLPNKLTLTRILLVPVFMVFVSLTSLNGIADGSFQPTYYLIAGIVFAVASFTDFLDGHLARKWNMVTDFGKFADPLADKLLTTVAFIYMMRDGVCSPVVLCIILAREFAVSGLRMVAAGAKDGKVIAANMWGKVKTVLQMLNIIGMVITVDRMEKALQGNQSAVQTVYETYGVPVYAIVNMEDIIAAIQNDVIPGKEYLDAMLAYREQYGVTA